MKYTGIIAAATLAFFASCSSCTKKHNRLPANPTNNEVYRDDNGNRWIYDAMMMRWVLSGTSGNSYYYYPSSGHYTNTSGARVTPPVSVSSGIMPRSHTSTSNVSSSKSSSSSKGAVFGSTGRSHSISA